MLSGAMHQQLGLISNFLRKLRFNGIKMFEMESGNSGFLRIPLRGRLEVAQEA